MKTYFQSWAIILPREDFLEITTETRPPSLPSQHGRSRSLGASEAPKTCKLVLYPALAREVAEKITQLWPPYQIAGWLKRQYPGDERRQVSHETVY